MIDLTSENLCNSLKIDFLTMTVHNIEPIKLLSILCKHSNLEFNKFTIVNRGSIPAYNYSYRYMDSSIVTINWHDERPNFGICLNMTGRGCQFIDNDFLQKINTDLKDYNHKVTRMDIALDDFTGDYIDVKNFSDIIHEFTEVTNKNLTTNTQKRNVQIYNVNDNNYSVAENLVFGNRSSSFMFRLYDKKIEQKRSDISYWKRLEIQLRQNRSQKTYEMLLSGSSLNEVFASQMFSCFRPLDKATSHFSEESKSYREIAPWYKSFLDSVSQLYRKCIF